MDMQALIEEMSALIVKIKSGQATQGEIEAFAAAASELNERAIVLRYKSYEAKVFGKPVAPPLENTAIVELDEPVIDELQSDVVIDEPMDTHTVVVAQEVDAALDNDPEEMSFDLFSMDNEEEIETVDLPFIASVDESISTTENEPSNENELTAEDGISVEEGIEATIMQDETVEMESDDRGPLLRYPEEEIEPAITPTDARIVVESTESEEILATDNEAYEDEVPAQEMLVSTNEETASGDVHPVYNRLSTEDNSLAARLMAVRLETLKGAFGFNERLQIIQELFDGSNDEFAQAIERLDTLNTKNEARNVVSNYAHQFAWDKDSNLALEFIQKVERRYA